MECKIFEKELFPNKKKKKKFHSFQKGFSEKKHSAKKNANQKTLVPSCTLLIIAEGTWNFFRFFAKKLRRFFGQKNHPNKSKTKKCGWVKFGGAFLMQFNPDFFYCWGPKIWVFQVKLFGKIKVFIIFWGPNANPKNIFAF